MAAARRVDCACNPEGAIGVSENHGPLRYARVPRGRGLRIGRSPHPARSSARHARRAGRLSLPVPPISGNQDLRRLRGAFRHRQHGAAIVLRRRHRSSSRHRRREHAPDRGRTLPAVFRNGEASLTMAMRAVLLAALIERLPDQRPRSEPPPGPVAIFPAKHPAIGEVTVRGTSGPARSRPGSRSQPSWPEAGFATSAITESSSRCSMTPPLTSNPRNWHEPANSPPSTERRTLNLEPFLNLEPSLNLF